MKKPNVGQLVWCRGRFGSFTVLRIDTAQGVVDIQSINRAGVIEQNVPFSAINPLGRQNLRQAAVQVVRLGLG